MPNSTRSSAASARFHPADRAAFAGTARIAWRPSRWLAWAMPLLGLLSACSLLASDLPAPLAWPGAVLACGYAAWLWRRERAHVEQTFVFGPGATPQVDGEPATDFVLQWRGPLAFASWRDAGGRRRHRAWWPDTLPAAARRELRLAAPATQAARGGASMAP